MNELSLVRISTECNPWQFRSARYVANGGVGRTVRHRLRERSVRRGVVVELIGLFHGARAAREYRIEELGVVASGVKTRTRSGARSKGTEDAIS